MTTTATPWDALTRPGLPPGLKNPPGFRPPPLPLRKQCAAQLEANEKARVAAQAERERKARQKDDEQAAELARLKNLLLGILRRQRNCTFADMEDAFEAAGGNRHAVAAALAALQRDGSIRHRRVYIYELRGV